MAEVNRYGKITLFIKDIGETIKLMAEVGSFIPMGMFMKENGRTIRLMDEESTITMMGLVILDNGFKTFKRDMEFRNGMTVHLLKGTVDNNIV